MSIQEIESKVEGLTADERRRLAAFLVSLRHKDLIDYRTRMTRKIEDQSSENWVTLKDLDQRLSS